MCFLRVLRGRSRGRCPRQTVTVCLSNKQLPDSGPIRNVNLVPPGPVGSRHTYRDRPTDNTEDVEDLLCDSILLSYKWVPH